jgi:hypothetical protein
MAKHLPGVVWSLRLPPNYGAAVQTADELTLLITMQDGISFEISRKDARLLACRINECLDATTNKGKMR